MQGLVEAWNFNQIEAQRAFAAAVEADPSCSRCWWGMAYALGPGANRWEPSACVTYDGHPLPRQLGSCGGRTPSAVSWSTQGSGAAAAVMLGCRLCSLVLSVAR